MKAWNNLIINRCKGLSANAYDRGIFHFEDLKLYLHALPYGRIADRTKLSKIFDESKGTCSTKHGLIKKSPKNRAMKTLN